MGIFGGAPKPKEQNVAEEQAKLKAQQDAAAREERDKAAASQANKENLAAAAADANAQSSRAAFMQGVVQDTEESRRKFLKKV